MRLDDHFAAGHGPAVSFEFSPPRTVEAELAFWGAIEELAALGPAGVSATCAAGGTTRDPPPARPPPPAGPRAAAGGGPARARDRLHPRRPDRAAARGRHRQRARAARR